jgi:hypothetical protein
LSENRGPLSISESVEHVCWQDKRPRAVPTQVQSNPEVRISELVLEVGVSGTHEIQRDGWQPRLICNQQGYPSIGVRLDDKSSATEPLELDGPITIRAAKGLAVWPDAVLGAGTSTLGLVLPAVFVNEEPNLEAFVLSERNAPMSVDSSAITFHSEGRTHLSNDQ